MADELSDLVAAADQLMVAMNGCVQNVVGKPSGLPTVSEPRHVAKLVKRFTAEAIKLPWLWTEMTRLSSLALQPVRVPNPLQLDDAVRRFAAGKRPKRLSKRNRFETFKEDPSNIYEDECFGCRWLLHASSRTLTELSGDYASGSPYTIHLNKIFVAVPTLVRWAVQNLPLVDPNLKGAARGTPARRGPKPKPDPDEAAIRQAYTDCGTIKATVEKLKLKPLGRVAACKRVERIVNRDRQTKSRAKKRS